MTLAVAQSPFTIDALTHVLRPEWITAALQATGNSLSLRRKLCPETMMWFVLLLGLHRRLSYHDVLEMLAGSEWGMERWSGQPPTDAAVPKARRRLGHEPLRRLFEIATKSWMATTSRGRRVVALDGTKFRLPDTPSNIAEFGVPGHSRGTRAAFPSMGALFAVDLDSRLVIAAAHGRCHTGELDLAREALDAIPASAVLVLDRLYQAFAFLHEMRERGFDFVVRLQGGPKAMRCDVTEEITDGDDLVNLRRPKIAGQKDPSLPEVLPLRRVVFEKPSRGDETKTTTLLTTLPAGDYDAAAIAGLYRRRWAIETTIHDLKCRMCDMGYISRVVVMRSKSAALVRQEFWATLVAHGVLSMLRYAAASDQDVDVDRVSFQACVTWTRELVSTTLQRPAAEAPEAVASTLAKLGRKRIRKQPGRECPRAVCVKMSSYPVKKRPPLEPVS